MNLQSIEEWRHDPRVCVSGVPLEVIDFLLATNRHLVSENTRLTTEMTAKERELGQAKDLLIQQREEAGLQVAALQVDLTSVKEEMQRYQTHGCWYIHPDNPNREECKNVIQRQDTERLRSDLQHLYEMVAQADTNKALSTGNSRQNILVISAQDIGRRHGFFNYWTEAASKSGKGEKA